MGPRPRDGVLSASWYKDTHTVVAVEEGTSRLLGELTVETREHGFAKLLRAGETVIPLPPKLMANARRGERTFAKSDSIDAIASRGRGCASQSCRKHG